MYDITKKETFEHLKDWMVELETYSNIQNSVKIVIGNKLDKAASDRQVTREQGVEYAKTIGALFIESSAKANVHIQDAFDELVLKILEHPTLLEGSSIHGGQGHRQRNPGQGVQMSHNDDSLYANHNQCSC